MGPDDLSLPLKLAAAGTSACFADFATFPLDTVKVRLQLQGESKTVMAMAGEGAVVHGASAHHYRGIFGTIATIVRTEGTRSLFNGLTAGLQRQMCFASVRIGFYDSVKTFYLKTLYGDNSTGLNIGVRIAAGLTTGAMAVLFAQPTDVVKVRFQAQLRGDTKNRYSSTMQAYKTIAKTEGAKGLWKGTLANASRNAIVNVSEIVCYDIIKESILKRDLMRDAMPCHFTSAVIAGLCTTVVASPVDVVKTRFMNSPPGTYKGAGHCALKMFGREGFSAFYKGFMPSFCRLVSWNIVMWVTYEQVKIFLFEKRKLLGAN